MPTASPGSMRARLYCSAVWVAALVTPLAVSLFFAKFCFSWFSRMGVIWFSTPLSCFLMWSADAISPFSSPSFIWSISRFTLTALPWSLFAGSTPSSPYLNWMMSPAESRTVLSYSKRMCSNALIKRLCM